MKRFLCIFLCVAMVFSSLCFSVSAKVNNSNFIQTEKDSGSVAFDCDYAQVGKTMTVTVGGKTDGNYVYRWYIDNALIDNITAAYTPLECDMQSMISVVVFDMSGNEIGNANMFVSNLPVIYIETANRATIVSKEIYTDANIKIQGNDEFSSEDVLYDGKAEIRGRGNSTWQADKKPYKIKLGSKANLLGMGKNKHWVLLSNPFDTSLMRNHLSYNLSADMGLEYQKSEWVEVVLNGKPVGNYQLCEHIRVGDNRVEITDWEGIAEDAAKAIYDENKDIMTKDERDELIDIMSADMSWTTSDTVTFMGVTYTVSDFIDVPDINGGYLTEIVRNVDGYTFTTDNGMCVDVDTPEVLSEDMLNYIHDYYQAFEDALFSEDFCTEYNGSTMRYTDFIDLESFVKGVIVNELFENYDFGRTSMWVYKEVDGKLVYGPVWDMDNTLMSTTFFRWTSLNMTWLQRLLSDPVFIEELRKTYFQYRYTAIQDILRDGGDIDKAVQKISVSAEYNDKIWESEITFKENVDDLRLRLQAKVNWFDTVLSDLSSAYSSMAYGIKNMEYVNSDEIALSFDKTSNALSIGFSKTIPSDVKVFADGKPCGSIDSVSAEQTVTLAKITDGAVISVVCYDNTGKVISGACLSTVDEVAKLEITALPEKLVYNAGEEIDLSGLVLTATNTVSGVKTVQPDLVYTYAKNTIGEKLFSYGKVTEEIGETYVVLRYKNAYAEYKIDVNPRENYEDVIALISALPSDMATGRFVKELFEAQVAFDALSEDAKEKVSNKNTLSDLFTKLSTATEDSASVIAVDTDSSFNLNARSNVLVFAKGEPKKIIFIHPDSSTATYAKNSQAYITEKKVGDYTVVTIKQMISADSNHSYSIKATYEDNRKSDAVDVSAQELYDMAKDINYVHRNSWVNQNAKFKVRINTDSGITRVRLYENGQKLDTTKSIADDGITLSYAFNEVGNHTVTLKYLIDGSWVEHSTFNVYVRDFSSDENRIYGIDYPAETYSKTIPVRISTSKDITSLSLVNENATVGMTSVKVDELKFWTAEIDIAENKEYVLYVNDQPTQTIISSTILDSFEINGTKLVKFLADTDVAEIPENITEIADDAFDGFDGTILCYPGSVAEDFAAEKGISCETFSFTVNASEIKLDTGDSFLIEVTATPYLPSDFELNALSDTDAVSFENGTITALVPGYSRLALSSTNGLFSHTVYVTVNGGPRKGDINADEKINSADALLVLQKSVDSIQLNADEAKAADISGDGKINSADALIILQISTGKYSIWDVI